MHRSQFQQKRSHHEYKPHERVPGEPDGIDTAQMLPSASRERLMKLFDDGTLRKGELDHKSVLTLNALSEPLQLKVIEHLEVERLFLTNSRSKAGFLVSACEKAKRGELDARGFGALDPWRVLMKAECIPRPSFTLIPEGTWRSTHSESKSFDVYVSFNGKQTVLSVTLNTLVSELKSNYIHLLTEKLAPSQHRVRLVHPVFGTLRDDKSMAFYNFGDSALYLSVKLKTRGGRKVHRISYFQ